MRKLIIAYFISLSSIVSLVAIAQTRPAVRRPRTVAEAERLAPTPPAPPPTPTENDRVCTTGRAYPNAIATLDWTEELDPRDALHARLVQGQSPMTPFLMSMCSIIQSIPPATVAGVAFAPGTSESVDPDEIYTVPGGWIPRTSYAGLAQHGRYGFRIGNTDTESVYACNVTLLRLRAQYPATAFCGLPVGARPADRLIRGRVALISTSRAYRPVVIH